MVSKRNLARRVLPRWFVATASGLAGVLIFLLGLYGFYAIVYADEVFPNTFVAGLDAGGLTADELTGALAERTASFVAVPLNLVVADEAVTLDPLSLELTYDDAQTVEAAMSVGRTGAVWQDLVTQVSALVTPISVPAHSQLSHERLEQFLSDLATKYDDPEEPVSVTVDEEVTIHDPVAGHRFDQRAVRTYLLASFAALTASGDAVFPRREVVPQISRAQVEVLRPRIAAILSTNLKLTAEKKSFTVDREQLATWLGFQTAQRGAQTTTLDGFYAHQGSVTEIAFDQDKVTAYLKTVADDVNQEPVDAKLTIKSGKAVVFQQSQDGLQLDEAKAHEQILAELDRRIDQPPAAVVMPVTIVKADVTSSTVDQLGIKELIGTATTDFSGSPSNRIHNITNGAKYLNGWLVKPGEEFSTVKALGAIDSSTGYLPELVIKENRTIPEYGGGLCQVSTTLFRAVLNAGLPVTERRQHSYRVSYYERDIGPGLDATIYLPKPDFKFTNDTPGWLLVQGAVNGVTVTFELYGTSDGRESSIDGPHTLSTTPAPETVYEETDQLAPGEEKQVEKPHAGATTVATYTVRRGGEVINEQTFQSKYKALPARILRGKTVAAEQPAPEQSAPPTEVTESVPSQAEEPVQTTTE